jgi:hypothetical protein
VSYVLVILCPQEEFRSRNPDMLACQCGSTGTPRRSNNRETAQPAEIRTARMHVALDEVRRDRRRTAGGAGGAPRKTARPIRPAVRDNAAKLDVRRAVTTELEKLGYQLDDTPGGLRSRRRSCAPLSHLLERANGVMMAPSYAGRYEEDRPAGRPRAARRVTGTASDRHADVCHGYPWARAAGRSCDRRASRRRSA